MNTKVLNLSLEENRRMLFVSDIHGNYKLLYRLLEKNNFSDSDYLFIIGDMIEKSNDSIKMLDEMMKLSKKPNVYIICGNCDEVIMHLIPPVNGKLIKYYSIERKKTIINDFARSLCVEIDFDTDMDELCALFYKEFKKYYDFIENLPHVLIINNKLVLCHGGLDDINNIPTNAIDVMKYDDFYTKSKGVKLPTIVGHYPTINYDSEIPSLNPIIDLKKNIISIDGGNNLVPWSQLNLLILDNLQSFNFSFDALDEYEKVMVIKETSHENKDLFNITKKPISIQILKEIDDFYLVLTEQNKKIYILKDEAIYSENTKQLRAYNGFNYFLNAKENEEVTLIRKAKPFSIVKKDGIVGLIETANLEDNNGKAI